MGFFLGEGKRGGGSSKQARVKVKLGNITDSYVYSTSEVGTQRQLMHPLLSCRRILTAPALHWQVWAGRQPSCRDVGRETNAVVVVVVVASSTAMQRHVWQPWPSASQVMTWPAVHWQRGVVLPHSGSSAARHCQSNSVDSSSEVAIIPQGAASAPCIA